MESDGNARYTQGEVEALLIGAKLADIPQNLIEFHFGDDLYSRRLTVKRTVFVINGVQSKIIKAVPDFYAEQGMTSVV